MEPANILFVIAFIGIPVAFGIWALVSRRELKRMPPPPERPAEPEHIEPDPVNEETAPPPQPTRQMPAAPPPAPRPQPEQPRPRPEPQATRQMPAATEEPAPPAPPARKPEAEQPKPRPEPAPTQQVIATTTLPPPPPQGQSYRSGTTEELPIIEMPDSPRPYSPPPESAAGVGRRSGQQSWQFSPARLRLARLNPAPRRPFYPPRYAGKSGGAVKRLTPRAAQSFLGPAVGLRRR